MCELIITDVEAEQIKSSDGPVVVRGPNGDILGFFMPPRTPDELDKEILERIRLNRNKPKVYVSTEHVLDRLKQLEAGECAGK